MKTLLTILATTVIILITQDAWKKYKMLLIIQDAERERHTALTILVRSGIIPMTQYLWKEYKTWARHRQWQRDETWTLKRQHSVHSS